MGSMRNLPGGIRGRAPAGKDSRYSWSGASGEIIERPHGQEAFPTTGAGSAAVSAGFPQDSNSSDAQMMLMNKIMKRYMVGEINWEAIKNQACKIWLKKPEYSFPGFALNQQKYDQGDDDGDDNTKHQFAVATWRLGWGVLSDGPDDRKSFDYGTDMRGLQQFLGQVLSGLVVRRVQPALPMGAVSDIINGPIDSDVSTPPVSSVVAGKLFSSHVFLLSSQYAWRKSGLDRRKFWLYNTRYFEIGKHTELSGKGHLKRTHDPVILLSRFHLITIWCL
jgi:hypothetical protein